MFDDGEYDQVEDSTDLGDEWYDDEPEYGFYQYTLCKAENGQLYVEEVYALTNGHTDSYYWSWYDEQSSISHYTEEFQDAAIAWSRTHKPGDSIDGYDLMDEYGEDDEDDE